MVTTEFEGEAITATSLMLPPRSSAQLSTFAGLGQESYVAMNGPSEFSFSGSLMSYERVSELHRLTLPVLYLSGEYDTCTPGAAREYAAATPNAEVAVIPGAGHATTIDAPDETNAAVRTFIEAHDA